MIKKTAKIMVLALALVFAAGLAFAADPDAGPKSNAFIATFGEIWEDGDNFFNVLGWQDVEFNNIFTFSRLGSDTPEGRVEFGAAFRPGPLYLSLYYRGTFIGQEQDSWRGKRNLSLSGNKDDVKISVRAMGKTNPNALYGVLAGLPNGWGLSFTFADNLKIEGNQATLTEEWDGSLTPALELGANFGPIQRIGLSVPITYNRTQSMSLGTGTGTVTYAANNNFIDSTTGNPIALAAVTQDDLIAAEGDYAQPTVSLRLGFGDNILIDNDLALRLYGIPARNIKDRAGRLFGIGFVNTVIDHDNDNKNSRTALWNSRFYIDNTLTPMYNVGGQNGRLTYSATAFAPVSIGFKSDSMNLFYDDQDNANPNHELSGFYKGRDFWFGVEAGLSAGVKFQVLNPLSVQAGALVDLFSWRMDRAKTVDVDPSAGDMAKLTAATATGAPFANRGLDWSGDSVGTEHSFSYPGLSIAAGFTFSFREMAALDMVFIKEANPTAVGTLYRAVGDGLGNSETSIVLTLKF